MPSSQPSNGRPVFVHPSAIVDAGAVLGSGTKVWHFCHVYGSARVGRDCILGQNVMVGPRVVLGNGVKVQNNVSIYEGVELEDHVFCGPSMVFTNVNNPRGHIERKSEFRRTLVRQGATLGANCTIVCGHTIGAYAFVGAGSVVTRDVPDHALVVGNPARFRAWVCACSARLAFDGSNATCPDCGKQYVNDRDGVRERPRSKQGGP